MASANVKDLEALERFAHSIVSLREGTRKQADEIREQLQRVSAWLAKELPDYWGNELRIAQNRWIEARQELARCQAKTRAEDESSCLVQRKMLERATARRQLCEQRARLVPQLAMQWEQFLQEVALSVRHLDDLADSSLPLAEERLRQSIAILREYMARIAELGPSTP